MRPVKLVLVGTLPARIGRTFAELLGSAPPTGRLVLNGDAFEFLLLTAPGGAELVVAKMAIAPFHGRRTLEVLLRGATDVVFVHDAEGYDPAEYLAEVRAVADPAATFEETSGGDALATCRRVIARRLGEPFAVSVAPVNWAALLALPAAFHPCFEGDVWGFCGPDGRRPLRPDLPTPERVQARLAPAGVWTRLLRGLGLAPLPLSRDQALRAAQSECRRRGWPWTLPVIVERWGSGYEVWTNAECRGGNVRVRVDGASGAVTHAHFARR